MFVELFGRKFVVEHCWSEFVDRTFLAELFGQFVGLTFLVEIVWSNLLVKLFWSDTWTPVSCRVVSRVALLSQMVVFPTIWLNMVTRDMARRYLGSKIFLHFVWSSSLRMCTLIFLLIS